MSIPGLSHPSRDDADPDAAKIAHQIQLLDNTGGDDPASPPSPSGTISSGTTSPASAQPSQPTKRRTRESLREEMAKRGLARQKYAKWQQERFEPDGGEASTAGERVHVDSKGARVHIGELEDNIEGSSGSESRITRAKSKVEHGRRRVRGLLNSRKAIKQAKDEDAVVDVLYENQRGSFFFGIPLFSSKSLLNFDPAPWENGKHKPSPVNITNASVPDPSWEWAWQSWYVDMSYDVDEEGWEYSFSFQKSLAWHGTHPWFHSFVRRRRWLRKRVRKQSIYGTEGQNLDPKRMSDAHMLNGDYFTIHAPKTKSRSSSQTRGWPSARFQLHEEGEEVEEDIPNVPTLMAHLKKATVDREKIVAVRRFLDQGGDEIFYLAEQMPTIMSLLVFQNSRRNLLSLLLQRFDSASQKAAASSEQQENRPSEGSDHLLQALRAADAECRKLEYWSDIRGMAVRGETVSAADEDAGWGRSAWRGVDDSGPGGAVKGAVQEFKEDAPAKEEEEKEADGEKVEGEGEGKERSDDGFVTDLSGDSEDDDERSRMSDKGKGRANH